MGRFLVRSRIFGVLLVGSTLGGCSLFVSLGGLTSNSDATSTDSGLPDVAPTDAAAADTAPQDDAGSDANAGNDAASDCSDPDLVAFFHFDEGSGTTTTDCVTGDVANLSGGVTWIAGHRSSALQFDGTSGVVDLGASRLAFDDVPFTVSVWLNITTAASAFMVGRGVPGATAGWRLGLDGNTISLRIGTGASEIYATTGSEAALVGTWAHVAATYTPNGNTIIYVNGAAAATTAATPPLVNDGTADPRIGASSNGQFFYSGATDDLRIYSRALSAAEVQTLAGE